MNVNEEDLLTYLKTIRLLVEKAIAIDEDGSIFSAEIIDELEEIDSKVEMLEDDLLRSV